VVFLHGADGPVISPLHRMLADGHEVVVFDQQLQVPEACATAWCDTRGWRAVRRYR
jgi:hypothetical protein